MLIFHSTITWKHFAGLLVTSAAYALSYKQLAQMAKPSYGDDGELLDGGYDMSTGGVCRYGFSRFISSIIQECSTPTVPIAITFYSYVYSYICFYI